MTHIDSFLGDIDPIFILWFIFDDLSTMSHLNYYAMTTYCWVMAEMTHIDHIPESYRSHTFWVSRKFQNIYFITHAWWLMYLSHSKCYVMILWWVIYYVIIAAITAFKDLYRHMTSSIMLLRNDYAMIT